MHNRSISDLTSQSEGDIRAHRTARGAHRIQSYLVQVSKHTGHPHLMCLTLGMEPLLWTRPWSYFSDVWLRSTNGTAHGTTQALSPS